MYDIAITVSACLQAGTRADVAWVAETTDLDVADWSDAVVFTPGGGKIGSLLSGALDGKLGELAGRTTSGRLVDVELSTVDALIAELPGGGSARVVLAPAATLPPELWEIAADRRRFVLVVDLADGEVAGTAVYTDDTVDAAATDVRDVYDTRPAGSTVTAERVISVFDAVPRMVIIGGGPIAEALAALAPLVGWQAEVTTDRDTASGLITPLSGHDKVVIAAHDLELAGAGLQAALGSRCGYIGSVGSRKMQADRADWLAYRGVTDLDRIHGPAGLDIGADNPGEVAVAIVAEAIVATRA